MDNFTIAVNKYLRDFGKIGKRKKVIILAILAGSFFFGIFMPITVTNLSYKKPTLPIPSPTPIPLPASLTVTSDKRQAALNDTFIATINIDSPNQGVEAADFVVNFDPEILRVATVSGGNYFGLYPVKTAENDNVKISGIANLVNNKFIIPKGRGTAGSITFEALSATDSTKISFDREKTIVASGGKNILDMEKIADLDIIIK